MQYSLPFGSKTIAKMMHIHSTADLNEASILKSAENGIYIGDEPKFKLPVFLNFENSINNHMFVVGMTGSGKSYFLKSLLLKMSLIHNYSAFIIDFTGEYNEFAKFMFAEEVTDFNPHICNGNVSYADLSEMKENDRINVAEKYLNSIINAAELEKTAKCTRFVILDEAWKLLSRGSILRKLIREGRKYGIGIIMASQMLEDVDSTVMENTATIVVFRLQDKRSLSNLAKNYNLPQEMIRAVQNLEVGSCLVIRLGKDSLRNTLFVERIPGRAPPRLIGIRLRGYMDFQIDEGRFVLLLKNVGISSEAEGDIIRSVSENGTELSALILKLAEAGADRMKILGELRRIGIAEDELADAFSIAMAKANK